MARPHREQHPPHFYEARTNVTTDGTTTSNAQRVRNTVTRFQRFWDPIHERAREYAAFVIDGQHYLDDDDDTNSTRDSRMIRWIGPESFHVYRHELGSTTSQPIDISARPLDEDGDPDLAELAVALLDFEVDDPTKEFHEVVEDAVGAAIVCGYGAARIEYDPDEGAWGELMLTEVAPDSLMWTPGVKSVHSRKCREVIERIRISRADAMRMPKWDRKVIAALPAASSREERSSQGKVTSSSARLGQGSNVDTTTTDDDVLELYMVWERRPPDTKKRPRRGTYSVLPEADRYMGCPHCGWKSPTQGDAGMEFPESHDSCFKCGVGPVHRIDAEEVVDEIRAYPDGRLTIVSLEGSGDEAVYEGAWPFRCRSYPYFHLQRYRHPLKTVGPSIASQHWWNQLALDLHYRIALERELTSQPYWMLPSDGLNDAFGERFEMSEENGQHMFYDGEAPPSVQLIEGTGIPNNWSVLQSAMSAGLVSHNGIADVGIGPTQSRDIAARSLELQVQQQEIPIAHFQRRYQRELGRLFSCYFDAIRETYPDARVLRLKGKDGADAVRKLRAADLPNFDFVVSAAPDFTGLDEKRAKGFEMLRQIAIETPQFLDVAAKVHKVPPSLVREMREAIKREQEDAARAQEQAAAAQSEMQSQPQPDTGAMGGQFPPDMAGGQYGSQQDNPAASVDALLGSLGFAQGDING